MKIGIIGCGAYSIGVACLLAKKTDNEIMIWSESADVLKEFNETKKLDSILKDIKIPKNIKLTNSYKSVLENKDIVFLMTGVKFIKNVCLDIKSIISKKVPIVIGTKGVYEDKKFVYQVVKKYLKNDLAILSGPTFASSLAQFEPVGFLVGTKSKHLEKVINNLFIKTNLKLEFSKDLKGISLCSSLKNVYAIGSGILSGVGYHDSTMGLYITEVYQELENILYHNNSKEETLNSLGGLGDLVATCISTQSRNFNYGKLLASKNLKKREEYLKKNTVEGYLTLEFVNSKLKKYPIITTIYNIALNNENPDKLREVLIKN